MKKRLLALLFAICLLLSACGKGAPEADSQPGTSSQSPASSSTGTTAPPTTATTAPPTTAPPINQEVMPQASYVWNGDKWPDIWTFVDWYAAEANITKKAFYTGSDYLAEEVLPPVYLEGLLPAALEVAPDDMYFIVYITTHPMVIRQYGMPDGSEEYYALLEATTTQLRERLEKAGYCIYPEVSPEYEKAFGTTRVVTIMSVAEIKALNCGDDFSVAIREYHWPN